MFNSYHGRLRGFFALMLMLVIGASTAFAQWTEVSAMNSARSFPETAYLSGKLYAFGGVSSTAYLKTAQAYDPATDKWTTLATMPQARFAGYAGAANGKIYLIGGAMTGGSSATFDAAVVEYDPAGNKYTQKAAMPAGGARAWFAGATVGNTIFMIGGSNASGASAEVWGYDATANTWQQYTDAPFAGYYWTATAIGNSIYLVGGTDGTNIFKSVYKGDISGTTITWSPVKNYPLFIYGAASGVVNGKLYVAGGADAQAGVVTDAVNAYDPAKDTWSFAYPLPAAQYYTTTMVGDGTTMYYVGGSGSAQVFKFTEGAPAAIAVLNQSDFLVTVKTGAQKSFSARLLNSGIIPLTGSIAIDAPSQGWLSTSSTINVQPGATTVLNFTANAGSLAEGKYTANVTINTNDPNNAAIPVKVTLFVRNELVQQPTKVVAEEATGAWCGWCPYGKDSLNALREQFPNNTIIVSYHGPSPAPYNEPMGSTAIDAMLDKLGMHSFPTAAINRWYWEDAGARVVDRSAWAEDARQILEKHPTAPVAIEVKNYNFDQATNRVSASLHITTAEALPSTSTTTYAVTAVVTEDSLDYEQHRYLLTGGDEYLSPYYHTDVARTIYPGPMGDALTLPPGSVAEDILLPGVSVDKDLSFTVQNVTDIQKAHIVFFVHAVDGTELGDILQGYEQPLAKISNPVMSVVSDVKSQIIAPAATAIYNTTVKNLTDQPLDVAIVRTQNDLPGGDWSSVFCINGDCKEETVSTGSVTLAPGATAAITVKVTGGLADKIGEVTLSFTANGQTMSEKYITTVQSTNSVGTTAVAGNALTLAQNVPNPASGVTRFSYNLPSAGNASVEIFSVTGQKVFSLDQGRQEAGVHAFTIDGAALPNGVYTVVISSNGARTTRAMTIVH
jgi:N-acetylneuraminic acid mutarotase